MPVVSNHGGFDQSFLYFLHYRTKYYRMILIYYLYIEIHGRFTFYIDISYTEEDTCISSGIQIKASGFELFGL